MPTVKTPSILVEPPRALLTATRRLLRPLVRLLLNYSMQYPQLANLLKLTYVEVATQMPLPGKAQSDSRVSMLTGIHRMDVKRLRSEIATGTEAPPASVSLGALAVARWTALADYLDGKGRPLPLPRLASSGNPVNFEALVQSVSKDIRPRVVLDEWLRLGVARVDEQDRVVLVTDAFVPRHGEDEKLFYVGKNVHDHLASCAHNLTQDAPPMLERSVYFDKLSLDSTLVLSAHARQLAMQATQAFAQKAMELQERDRLNADAQHRITFGQYCYEVNEQAESGKPQP